MLLLLQSAAMAAEHLRNLIRFNADDPNAVEDEFDSHIGLKPRGDEE